MTPTRTPARFVRALATFALALAPLAGFAHDGDHAAPGIAAGILHPLTGLDHLLAMLAVGLWASQLRERAAWMLPALFPATMVLGAVLALRGVALPAAEPFIAASVIVLGALIALRLRMPVAASGALVAVFAVAHGYAHGNEMPAGGDPLGYAVGFVGATIALHLVGLFLGLALGRRPRGGQLARIGGSAIAIAIAGLALITG